MHFVHKIDLLTSNPWYRRTGLTVIILFLTVVDPLVDIVVQPEIPFFNKEHFIVGLISGGIGFFFMGLTAYLVRRITRMEYEKTALVHHFEFLSKYSNDIVMVASDERKIIEANDRALATYGYTAEELHAIDPLSLRVPEERSAFPALLDRLKMDDGFVFETRHQRKDGTTFPVEVSARLLQREGRMYYQTIIRDITERKHAEDAIRQQRDRLRSLAVHVDAIREEERKNLAREIHDQLGQELTAIKMNIAVLAAKTKQDEWLTAKIRDIRGLVDASILSVRRISQALRPGVLDELGLSAAIEWQTRDFEKQYGIGCSCEIGSVPSALKEGIPIVMFRILQESLTNVARHAEATHVHVKFEAVQHALKLTVEDNGKGIDIAMKQKKTSHGILGMKERAYNFGGTVAITRRPEGGTLVTAHIPEALQ
ncbi:MAG: PAS domain S-box protein [Acidobacteriota bacterium]